MKDDRINLVSEVNLIIINMRQKLRGTLKSILKVLSRFAITKHKIRIIAVSGWYGTSVVKESLYQVLKEDFQVRRNTRDISWDFSIPLTLLGYPDLKYGFRGWLKVIFSTIWVLIFEKSNPHIQILELDADKREIYEYWLSILSPEILILVNSNPSMVDVENLLIDSISEGGLLICKPSKKKEVTGDEGRNVEVMVFDEGGDVLLKEQRLRFRDQEYEFKSIHPSFIKELMILTIPVVNFLKLDVDTAIHKLKTFEFSNQKLSRVMERIKIHGE